MTELFAERLDPVTIVDVIPGARAAMESGQWPQEYFAALLGPMAVWSADNATRFHHVGYTFPDRDSFEAATAAAGPNLIASDLVTPTAVHHRRYVEVPGTDGGPSSFREYHVVGDEGNGVTGVHFDFTTEGVEWFLSELQVDLETPGGIPGARLVTQTFGGGNAPVGKVGLQPVDNSSLEVGIMTRTHWSHPAEW
jgi:hypothetical protein